MAALEPFEPKPHLAVAVSGGADSMALCLLADAWARARGGRVTALTVDHRLRLESAAEAAQVTEWLGGRGIATVTLVRPGPAPASRLQERAREARYALMTAWCRDNGVLHLLLGHHRGDQAETVLMRRRRASGVRGLAGMATVVETADVRLLRPLLTVAPERLRAVLTAARQPWIEDPSNRDRRFERVRVRADLAALDAGAVDAVLADAARQAAADAALEAATARALALHASVHPGGFAWVGADLATAVEPACATRALARLLTAVGGRRYGPAAGAVATLLANVVAARSPPGATLHGCRITWHGGRLLICRENRPPPPAPLRSGARLTWDGRFLVEVPDGADDGCRLEVLGAAGWRTVAATEPALRGTAVPPPARPTLPAVTDAAGPLVVPHLGFVRPGGPQDSAAARVRLTFRPLRPLTECTSFLESSK